MVATFNIPLSRHKEHERRELLDQLLQRLALMVSGNPWYCSKDSKLEHDPTGNNWQIGVGNDYFLHRRGPDEFSFEYRYGDAYEQTTLTAAIVLMLGLRSAQHNRTPVSPEIAQL